MPPNDFNDWHDLVKDFVQHLVDRYGIDEVKDWYFEVWNGELLSTYRLYPTYCLGDTSQALCT